MADERSREQEELDKKVQYIDRNTRGQYEHVRARVPL
jgi:hypothetical protein